MVSSVNSNQSIATFTLDNDITFKGCYAGSTTVSETSETSAVASASLSPSYLSSIASASAASTASSSITSINPNSYYPGIGIPTHGVFPEGSQDTASGLSSGSKIGITIGVLAAALVATVLAMALVYRRWKQKQAGNTSRGSKAARFANGRWVTEEDRNSAELKEVNAYQV
ncbi:hypothetical protein CBS101457_005595 [Exobasidium rhododendri]|nr:hypothetical protein CBS101457_005595 [Exobasidium rhododendri]